MLFVTAGSIFIMWLGELITEKGIGNGISLIIFAGIVAGIPQNITALSLASVTGEKVAVLDADSVEWGYRHGDSILYP